MIANTIITVVDAMTTAISTEQAFCKKEGCKKMTRRIANERMNGIISNDM
jgi:hypothetical protein